ncbi:MAG TPA: glycosyltransferase family 87 protein [Candidatus Sulfotelmatobacter sp.]|nr:glycosyltransferase family 87 protein [Candidatus Sulfotelmatobacter sp.]
MIYYHQGLFMPRVVAVRTANGLGNGYSFGNDFYQVWLTSREWLRHGSDPYSLEMTQKIQIGLYGRPLDPTRPTDPVDRRVFPYPVYADLLFWPAAEFPFAPLRVAVVCVLAALTFASVPLWLRVLDWRLGAKWITVILLLTMSSYPALEALFAAQLGLLVAFLLAASLVALRRGRFLLAGILMAISTIKPQVTVLAIVYFLIWSAHDWRVRGRFCLGFFTTLTLLVGASLAAMPHWIQSWTHTILAYRHYTRPPLVTEVLTSPLGPRLAGPATFLLTAASIVIAILLAWRNRAAACGSFAFWMTLTLLLSITTITILPGQAIYDHLILLPGILLLVRYRSQILEGGRVPSTLLSIGALVLFWPWIAAFALSVLRPWIAPADFDTTAVLTLPIRTAASLPFTVLALLSWTMRLIPARLIPARNPEGA